MSVARAIMCLLALAGLGAHAGCREQTGLFSPRRAAASESPARPMPRPIRAMWVARFHYRYADDVRTIVRNCAELGCNTILWQVRGEGTVCYPSAIEPWAREFDYADPGFDPLALAVEEAHRAGLRIEAWVNVLPGWKGPQAPPIQNQLWNTHPDWFIRDAAGKRQPLADARKPKEGFYLILNPCLPEVRRYITSIVDEITANYAVDGIHLDYVRYAWETTPNAAKLYPRDAATLKLYRRETNMAPDDDPAAWNHWRANQLTRLVSDMRTVVQRRRPGASLTAAVRPEPNDAYNGYLQNAAGWLRSGLIDAAMPMAYTDKVEILERDVTAYRSLAPGARVVPGIGIYKHDREDEMQEQMERCRAWGGDFALFSYESLLPTAGDRPKGPSATVQSQREMRRAVLAQFSAP